MFTVVCEALVYLFILTMFLLGLAVWVKEKLDDRSNS